MQKIRLQSQKGNEVFIIDLSRISTIRSHKNRLGLNNMRFEFNTDEDAADVYTAIAAMTTAENADKKGIQEMQQRFKSMMYYRRY